MLQANGEAEHLFAMPITWQKSYQLDVLGQNTEASLLPAVPHTIQQLNPPHTKPQCCGIPVNHPAGPIDDSAPSTAQLIAEAAQGRLTRSLHAVLSALQPQQPCCDTLPPPQQQQQQCLVQRRPRVAAAVHPGEVLSRLAWYVPEGVLEPGLQQDAAEALEVRLRLAWGLSGSDRAWLHVQAGLSVGL